MGEYELTPEQIEKIALSMQGVSDLRDDVKEIKRLLTDEARSCKDCKKEIDGEILTIKTLHAEERGANRSNSRIAIIISAAIAAIGVLFSIYNSVKNG